MMRLVSIRTADGTHAGAVVDGHVVDVQRALENAGTAWATAQPTMRALLEIFGARLDQVFEAVRAAGDEARVGAVTEVDLAPPVTDPEKVLCIGLNYADHVAETGRALPKYPDVFTKFARSLLGPNDQIRALNVTDQLDFEGELAIVIGREAKGVSREDARDYIAGVMVLNDITARDLQYRGTQWTMGKAVDRSTPCGPALVTLDEVPDLQALDISTTVNGVEMQRSNTRHMIFPIAEIVEYVSRTITLVPGDIIATGTPDGIGAKRTPPVWLDAGDVVEVTVEKVGVLRSTIAARR